MGQRHQKQAHADALAFFVSELVPAPGFPT
jgi:hypothetical protein